MSNKNGDLRVWWIPQVPMKSFYINVKTLEEDNLLLNALADYDRFQYENNVKPDYCNAGGLSVWDDTLPDEDDPSNCWCEWYDEETGEDFDEHRSRMFI